MATVTTTRTATGVPARYQEKGVFCDVATYEASALAASDVIQMVKVAAGVTVLDVKIVFDDMGTGITFDVGYGDDVDYFMDGIDVATAGGVSYATAATAFPKTFAAEDTIDIVNLGGTATGTVTLIAYMTAETVDLT